MDLKIIIATHKEYLMPEGNTYLPVFAGAALSDLDLPYQRDDEGENISLKNSSYCELTALYWAYRNLKADFIGLCHYRRFPDLKEVDLKKYDVILPKKRHYYIETVYSQFAHAHGPAGLDKAREVIKNSFPDYLDSFDSRMKKRSLHIFNMFIMKYDMFISYCDFLFSVLEKIEKDLGDTDRLCGYIGERLLDVYLEKNQIAYQEVKVIETEQVNWAKKIFGFLKRKYLR